MQNPHIESHITKFFESLFHPHLNDICENNRNKKKILFQMKIKNGNKYSFIKNKNSKKIIESIFNNFFIDFNIKSHIECNINKKNDYIYIFYSDDYIEKLDNQDNKRIKLEIPNQEKNNDGYQTPNQEKNSNGYHTPIKSNIFYESQSLFSNNFDIKTNETPTRMSVPPGFQPFRTSVSPCFRPLSETKIVPLSFSDSPFTYGLSINIK